MKTIELANWEDFDSQIRNIEEEIAASRDTGSSSFLYRGQSDAVWGLDTTLERFDPKCIDFMDYYRLMRMALPQIEAHTSERSWSLPTIERYQDWVNAYDPVSLGNFPAYELMAYLRHHGFPSPLLDWSRSPYVAAFFAFRARASQSDRAAVFVYCADTGHGRTSGSATPEIISLNQFVSTHRRHFLQQCMYTVCAGYGTSWRHVPHETVFADPATPNQDALWKLTLPRAERNKVLARLDQFNLNAHSLFGSEETLMETIAERAARMR